MHLDVARIDGDISNISWRMGHGHALMRNECAATEQSRLADALLWTRCAPIWRLEAAAMKPPQMGERAAAARLEVTERYFYTCVASTLE